MVTGNAFDHAVRLARENSGLAVGIHLVTVQGKAVLSHSEIPNLVDREDRFAQSPTVAGLKYYFIKKARQQLKRELTAQFQRFHATGLQLSHVDSHLHMHVHPVIFSAAVELAEHYGVKKMRVPQDDFRLALRFRKLAARNSSSSLLNVGSGDLLAGAFTNLIFGLLTRRMKRYLRDRGFSFADHVYGHFNSGRMTLEYVLFILDHLSALTNEVYFHPEALEDRGEFPLERGQGARELDILTNSKLKKRLHHPSVNLTNYFGLAANK
jgi:hopanoid biosynthesis associated protein HpnK